MRRWLMAVAAVMAVAASAPVTAQRTGEEGVKVGRPSFVRKLVSADKIEQAALQQYGQLREQATSRNVLAPPDDPQARRVRRIADELLPHTHKWNPRAKDWRWEVVVIKTRAINALCMPGGKIAVFLGLLETLKLTDDEVAMIIGHEMAHALREHARERAAKTTLTNVGAMAVALLIGGNVGELARQSGGLLTLKFSRDDEKEADLIGMELAARAGYDPEAGITLWRKMSQVARGARPQWLSTHPSGDTRVQLIRDNLKDVAGLYARARANRRPSPN